MGYTKTGSRARVRSVQRFERAMKTRDVNSAELARLAGTSLANISNIRRKRVYRVREDTAISLERALKVERGTLFEYAEGRSAA